MKLSAERHAEFGFRELKAVGAPAEWWKLNMDEDPLMFRVPSGATWRLNFPQGEIEQIKIGLMLDSESQV